MSDGGVPGWTRGEPAMKLPPLVEPNTSSATGGAEGSSVRGLRGAGGTESSPAVWAGPDAYGVASWAARSVVVSRRLGPSFGGVDGRGQRRVSRYLARTSVSCSGSGQRRRRPILMPFVVLVGVAGAILSRHRCCSILAHWDCSSVV